MSLLMDALKKAEKAREAERTQGGATSSDPPAQDTGEHKAERIPATPFPAESPDDPDLLSLEPLPGEPGADYGDLDDTRIRQTDPPGAGGTLDLSFDLDEAVAETAGEPNGSAVPPAAPTRPSGPGLSADEAYFPEDTSATLPSLKVARRSVDDYFDGTRPMPSVSDLDDDTTITTERPSIAQAQQDAAKTVISAKQRPPSGRGRRYLVFAILPIIILVGGVAGYYYWWTMVATTQVVNRDRPPPPAPRQIAQTESPPAPALTPSDAPPPAVPPLPEVQPVTVDVTPAAPPVAGTVASVPAGLAAQAAQPAEPEPGPAPVTPAAPVMPTVADANTEALLQSGSELMASAMLPADQPISPVIKIAKKHVRSRIHPLLTRGYKAYRQGDLGSAAKAYRGIIRRQPNNRDALLGIAAVETARGDNETASRHYLRILQLNPRDTVAQAALLSLSENLDPVKSESRLKDLIDREPDAAYLYFGLGNVYAGQQRWPEAQAAYFSAYTRAPDNADYAFNLAVALDHMSQRNTALTYYQRALQLVDANRGGFQTSDVLARIKAMRVAAE